MKRYWIIQALTLLWLQGYGNLRPTTIISQAPPKLTKTKRKQSMQGQVSDYMVIQVYVTTNPLNS